MFKNLEFNRASSDVLTLRFHTDGGPTTFTGQLHTDFPGHCMRSGITGCLF
jgi:hypothetical protein